MVSDRRTHPRHDTDLLWRPAAQWETRHGVADLSLGGARVYSDELFPVGARLEVELTRPDGATIEVCTLVVRVTILRPTGPAFCAVALQFVGVPDEARSCLEGWLGTLSASRPALQPGVQEHHGEDVQDVEDQHREECLPEPASRVSVARCPDGDRHRCEEDRDEDELLHRRTH